MLDVSLSPGDPVFWLHHTYLDKLWWQWQSLNLSSRLTDMSGTNIEANFGANFSSMVDLSCFKGFVEIGTLP
jgi:tyrosinase